MWFIISRLPELISFLVLVVHPLSAAGIRIGIDENSEDIHPSYDIKNGLQIPITNDLRFRITNDIEFLITNPDDNFRMNCLLTSRDLPLGSSDLIDVSTVQ